MKFSHQYQSEDEVGHCPDELAGSDSYVVHFVPGFLPFHDDVINWKHFRRYWPLSGESTSHSPVDSPHKGQWGGAAMFSLIRAWTNNRNNGDLRHHRAHYDVTVMLQWRDGWHQLNVLYRLLQWHPIRNFSSPFVRESLVTGGFPPQRVSNAESVFMPWCHRKLYCTCNIIWSNSFSE